MNNPITRRRLLLTSCAAGAAVWAGSARSTTAVAAGLDYDGRDAFDLAEQAFLGQGFTDNEGGGYAWGASYYLLGLLRMYEAYEDQDYLDRFADYAGEVLDRTDDARGVTDYGGRSGTVWRAAGNYTAGHGTVVDAASEPAVQLRWAGTQSAATTGEITAGPGDRFTLALSNPGTETLTLTDVSLDPDDDRYIVSVVNAAYRTNARWTAVDLRSTPAPAAPGSGVIAFEPQYYVFAVHTGMISYPLAKYARIVLGSPALAEGRHGGQARRILAAVRRAVAFHDHEFVQRPDGTGDYVFTRGAPIPFDGTIEPYNQSHGLGQTCAELYRLTGEKRYRTTIDAMLAAFEHGLAPGGPEEATSWSYWPVNSELYRGYAADEEISDYTPSFTPSQQIEDISHAAISVEFVAAAADAGVERATALLPRFVATYRDHVVRSDTEVWLRVDGTTDAAASSAVQCARWVVCSRLDDEVYRHGLRLYDAVQLEPDQGSHALGIGYLNWGRKKGWA